jgi:hypothetical protein
MVQGVSLIVQSCVTSFMEDPLYIIFIIQYFIPVILNNSKKLSQLVFILKSPFSLFRGLFIVVLIKKWFNFAESGAEYSYIREAFGSLAAFLYVWVKMLKCILNSFQYLNFHIYLIF